MDSCAWAETEASHPIIGLNRRVDTLQAAILLEILEVFPDEVVNRQNLGHTYVESLSHLEDLIPLGLENITPRFTLNAQFFLMKEKRFNNPWKKRVFLRFPITL